MPSRRPALLMVNDHPPSRTALRKALEGAGYTVWDAPSPVRLVSRLQVDRPDAVLLETRRAWTDCYSLCRSLKRSAAFGHLPVLLLGAREPGARVLESGCDRCLDAEDAPGSVLAALRELLAAPGDAR
jgi:CheY-like chemotaxis protein